NKRDLPDAMSVEELNRLLNPYNAPTYEAIANTGQGVFPTLKALAARVLESIHTGSKGAAPVSSDQTGYYPVPGAQQPASAAAPRSLQQTGFHAAPQIAGQNSQPAPPLSIPVSANPGAMPIAAQAPGIPPRTPAQYPDALARTGVHPPPPPMQPYAAGLARTGIHPAPHMNIPPLPQPGAA